MPNIEYNGWTNRNTWLINLYFGDNPSYIIEGASDVDEAAEMIEAYVDSYVEELLDGLRDNALIGDFIDYRDVNWRELAKDWLDEMALDNDCEDEEQAND